MKLFRLFAASLPVSCRRAIWDAGKVCVAAGMLLWPALVSGQTIVAIGDVQPAPSFLPVWNTGSPLFVGGINGKGELMILNGASVSSPSGYIGYYPHSAGSAVTVAGVNSIWRNTQDLYVGVLGSGTLTISGGGKVSNKEGYIGYQTASNSMVKVTGSGSTWTNTGGLHVGSENGVGMLTVEDNGIVEASTISIVSGAMVELKSGGTLRALSNHTNWIASSGVFTFGTGGGRIDTNGFNVGIGAFSGSGSLTKTGAGTLTLNTANINYTGSITIRAGQLNIATNANLGNSTSPLTIDGGTLHNSADLVMNRGIVIGEDHATLDVETGYLTLRAPISGVGGLTKTGGNILTLTGTNSYTGRTVISKGNFKVENGTLASTSVALAAGTIFYMDNLPSYAGEISGAGSMVKTGAQTTTLTGRQTYTGATTIHAGTLRLETSNISLRYHIDSGAVLELAPVTDGYSANSTFTGSGILRKTGTVAARWASPSATFALDAGSLIDVQAGTFVGGSNSNEVWTDNKSGLHVAAGAEFNGVEANVRVDALTGSGIIRSGFLPSDYKSFTFGVANGSGVFSGSLVSGNYVKTGTGTQTLTGTNTYTGTTTIAAGKLVVDGSISRSSLTTVEDGASLGGTGTIGNLHIASGGILSPGNSTGLLTVEGDLTLDSAAWTLLELGSLTDFDRIAVSGALTFGGTLAIRFTDDYTPLENDTFALFGGGYTWNGEGMFSNLDFSNPAYTGIFDYDTGVLTIVAVPEPSVYGLTAAAVAILAILHRRRCRAA